MVLEALFQSISSRLFPRLAEEDLEDDGETADEETTQEEHEGEGRSAREDRDGTFVQSDGIGVRAGSVEEDAEMNYLHDAGLLFSEAERDVAQRHDISRAFRCIIIRLHFPMEC